MVLLMSMTKKIRKLNGAWPSQSGQGLVEYILLLVVIIALASALLYQFIPAIKNVVDFQLGSYLQCLLDQGELPGLGGDNDVQDCEFNPVNVAGNSASSNKQGSGNSSNISNTNRNRDSNNSEPTNDSTQARGGRAGSSSGSGSGADTRVFEANRQKSLALAQGESGEVTETASRDESGSANSTNLEVSNLSNLQRESIKRRRLRRLPRGMEIASSQKRKKEQTIPTLEVKKAQDESGAEPRQKAFKFDPAKPLRTPAEAPSEPWSISAILKYILIIAGLIIILWVIGSQIAQVARSQEK